MEHIADIFQLLWLFILTRWLNSVGKAQNADTVLIMGQLKRLSSHINRNNGYHPNAGD